jgi:hypothetical protein
MRRFLANREDIVWIQPGQVSRGTETSRQDRIQSVIDEVDALGLDGGHEERKEGR